MIPTPTTPHEAEALMGVQVVARDGRVLRLDGYTGSGRTWRVESGGARVDLASCRALTPDELASLAAARAPREAESVPRGHVAAGDGEHASAPLQDPGGERGVCLPAAAAPGLAREADRGGADGGAGSGQED